MCIICIMYHIYHMYNLYYMYHMYHTDHECMCVFAKIRPKNVTNFVVEKWEKSYTKLASRKCDHNKSVHPCARAVAKVVRVPRSEVSERHGAGSWVWAVAKIRLEIL